MRTAICFSVVSSPSARTAFRHDSNWSFLRGSCAQNLSKIKLN